MTHEEKLDLVKSLFWDYKVDPEEAVRALEGHTERIGKLHRNELFIKLLNFYPWHKVILSETFVLRYGTKDEAFYRVFVRENPKDPELKLEFINDVFFHKGELIKHQLFSKVDSWMNILSNKVTALSRCAPKDVADILFICFKYAFSWKEVIEDARMKDAWINEIVASETLYEFDPASLSQVQWINKDNTSKLFAEELKIIARELLHGIDNSLVTK
jgi:hypothetical protein